MGCNERKQMIYFVRHAEATHNIKEREAVEAAKRRGIHEKEEQEKARRAVLQDEALRDAPLSQNGRSQVGRASGMLNLLNKACGSKYPPPTLVLVSPLRRALMTATQLFWLDATLPLPTFIAVEALREKRTGFVADEHSAVSVLEEEFPHVDFSDLREGRGEGVIPKGEDNAALRRRGRDFLEGRLARTQDESVAIVTHKGWLREFRHTIKEYEDQQAIRVDFDMDQWHQTLFGNAEVRVAQFGWMDGKFASIVSKSVENALGSVVEDDVKHLIEEELKLLYQTSI